MFREDIVDMGKKLIFTNSQDNKERSEKERKAKKNNSKNSESQNDSDEGIQKRKTGQQKTLMESESKGSGSDKGNELSPTEIKEVTNVLRTEEDNDVKKIITENERLTQMTLILIN